MKNLTRVVVFAIIAFSTLTVFAQKKEKKFTGTVTYNLESVGATPIPVHENTQTIKFLENRISLNNGYVLVNDRIVYQIHDYSQFQPYAKELGIGDYYTGPWKGYTKEEVSQGTIDSLSLNENYKIEYLDETKDMAGITAKKAIIHVTNINTSETSNTEIWYTDTMGPDFSLLFVYGLNGFPLEFTQNFGNDMAIKWTAKEVSKKKLKEAEFLLPAGFDQITSEQLEELGEVLQELSESMQ